MIDITWIVFALFFFIAWRFEVCSDRKKHFIFADLVLYRVFCFVVILVGVLIMSGVLPLSDECLEQESYCEKYNEKQTLTIYNDKKKSITIQCGEVKKTANYGVAVKHGF